MEPISLKDLIEEMQTISEEYFVYLDTATGKLIGVDREDLNDVQEMQNEQEMKSYPEWKQDVFREVRNILNAPEGAYLKLPEKVGINEYTIMESFCQGYPKSVVRAALVNSIKGSGAFRRFRETAKRFNAEQDWFKFKDQAYKQAAIEWLNQHAMTYQDDLE